MPNSASKLLFGIAAGTLVAAGIYSFASSDRVGFTVLLGIALATALGGLVLTLAGANDYAPSQASLRGAEAPPLEMVPVDRSLVSRPSPFPVLTAVALGAFGVGLAAGHALVIIAVVFGLLVALGWLIQSWREDPSFTGREGVWISNRLLTPFGLPLLALALIAVIVLSVSRVLLAVPKDASIAIAFGLAVLLLIAFFILASLPRVRRPTIFLLSGFAAVLLITVGSVSAASGFRTFEHPETGAAPAVTVVAQGTKYNIKQIDVTQGQTATIVFRNQDAGVYHNVAVYTETSGGSPVWNGEPIQGVKKITYTQLFNVAPGTYTFRCDFHPTAMIGKFVVKAPGS